MKYLAVLLILLPGAAAATEKPTITVGSKIFTESYILAEIVAQTIEDAGEVTVKRRAGMGATGIIYEALVRGNVDIYPEYTATITEAILKDDRLDTIRDINQALESHNLAITRSLGFNNTYALALKRHFAEKNGISKISDLAKHPEIRAGFTHEFIKRADGLNGLLQTYGLKFQNYKGMEHSLAYESLEKGKVDLVEVYSTDAKIARYDLKVLDDDKHYFREYLAVLFYRHPLEHYPKTIAALRRLEDSITESKMIELNAKAEIDKWPFGKIAAYFLKKDVSEGNSQFALLLRRTKEHLFLVFISLVVAILVGIPMGVLATRSEILAQIVLAVSGLLQTIPSLALLCFLIPLFGIGFSPSVVALFLYALLPIIRSTYLGLKSIDLRLIESAKTLGLSSHDILFRIEMPLASPAILSGIQLSAVINVGTATLAAFIGAGGYGAFIVTGLALNDPGTILQGAVPSAVLALLVHGVFELAEHRLIPKGLRRK